MPGFEGLACDRMSCELDCNGHGSCVSMSYNAAEENLDFTLAVPKTIYPYTTPWDARKIYGCRCDQYYAGHDCSVRVCPVGDDPMTSGQLNEIQLLKCTATTGTFTLQFGLATSEPIAWDASAQTVVNTLRPLAEVAVIFKASGATVCKSDGTEIVTIEFLQDFGKLSALVAGGAQSSNVQIAAHGTSMFDGTNTYLSVTGTKESIPCSGRGLCDTLTGVCTCYTSYQTSNGLGQPGSRGDCGSTIGGITACPGQGLACTGHGVCSNSPQYKCLCAAGWMGGDCAERTCPFGKSWFDKPIASNRAHQMVECSNKGVCDRTKGECLCAVNYVGGACSRMGCPGNLGTGVLCSGHGQCLSQGQLAQESDMYSNGVATTFTYGAIPNDPLTWDFDQTYGCKCDVGYTGYDCALRACPYGDDPMTRNQLFETQVYKCVASAGSFLLTFRQQITATIAWNANQATVKAALEALTSVGTVDVVFSTGTAACGTDPSSSGNKISITYRTELNKLPPLVEDVTGLTQVASNTKWTAAVHGAAIDGISSVAGTKENIECSGRGICDQTTGTCTCFLGYGSSDGNAGVGTRGDCGYVLPTLTTFV